MTRTVGDIQGRPGAGALLDAQIRFAAVGMWRTRVVLVFTFLFPVVWLLMVGALAGNAVLDARSGLRVMQFATPTAVAMGVLYAAYPTVAISFAEAREQGVLKRLRGTPLPAWIDVAGRIGGAAVFAVASVAASIAVGVFAFGVRLVWRTVPATVVTLLLGIVCFAAIGLAVSALTPSQGVAQAASIGTAVALTFLSGMFTLDSTLPVWLERVGDALPLKPFTQLLQDQFDPFHPGLGWESAHLAVVLAWGLGAALLATRTFRWEPHRHRPPSAAGPSAGTTTAPAAPVATTARRTTALGRVRGQAAAAARSVLRDPSGLFFALVMPTGLFVFFGTTQGDGVLAAIGVPYAVFFGASMTVWGTAVAVFSDLPQAVALARERGVLKRLRGTPLGPMEYLAGRVVAATGLAVLISAVLLILGTVFFDLHLTVGGALLGLGVLVLGTLTLAACGLAVAGAVRTARAVGSVALLLMFPLAFFSDVFIINPPAWMHTVGALFPLRHLQNALVDAWRPGGPVVGWTHLGALLCWLLVGVALTARSFRWGAGSE